MPPVEYAEPDGETVSQFAELCAVQLMSWFGLTVKPTQPLGYVEMLAPLWIEREIAAGEIETEVVVVAAVTETKTVLVWHKK